MTDPRTAAPAAITAAAPTGSGAVDEAVVIWRALAALGVRDVVLAPGSRSAPFVYALQDAEVAGAIRPHVRIDERAAAFTALGISRADPAHPGVVVTTSGTATVHLHAAVLEAHHAGVPLIVLTADRPAELRGVGANQTTDQSDLFGHAVRLRADLPAPAAGRASAVELRTAVSTMARAMAAATGADPGPVHVNVGLRDPLTPRPTEAEEPQERQQIVLTRRIPPSGLQPVAIPVTGRTVVLAGDGAGAEAAALAARHHLPLLAEPSSGARRGDALICGHVDLVAEVMGHRDHPLRPDRVIVMGRPTLSRPLVSGLLGADDVDVVVVSAAATWPDAVRRARLVVPAVTCTEEEPAREDAGSASPGQAQRRFLAAWQVAGDPVARSAPWQVRAALAVWEATEAQDALVLGSSSLVRDLEQHAGPTEGMVIANRGLAGIDGIVSTATGYALARRATGGRVRVLLGDLTAVHDLTGLVIGPDETVPDLDIVIVDDGGGRIFSGLEHAGAEPDVLRRFFTTPHGADLAAVAQALGAPAEVATADDLGTILTAPRGGKGTAGGGRRVIVVREQSASAGL